jgi:membrane-bound metal-dependent hydrolase YbcI (DUF457 family)
MMAPQHVRSGVAVSLGLAVLAAEYGGVLRFADVSLFAAIAGGAALLPDWDSRTSTVTRALPFVTVPIHWIITWSHRAVYSATRRGHDPTSRTRTGWRTAHRGLTHTVPTAIVVSVLFAAVLYAGGWILTVILLVALVLLAEDYVYARILLPVYTATTVYQYGSVMDAAMHVYSLGWLWGMALFVGWMSHLLGDCPTTAGVPILAPFTWKKLVLPVSFKTGGWFEMYVVRFGLLLAIVYLMFILTVMSLRG